MKDRRNAWWETACVLTDLDVIEDHEVMVSLGWQEHELLLLERSRLGAGRGGGHLEGLTHRAAHDERQVCHTQPHETRHRVSSWTSTVWIRAAA